MLYFRLFRAKLHVNQLSDEKKIVYLYTVDSRYLEFQGTRWNTSRYPYLDISESREWGKQ